MCKNVKIPLFDLSNNETNRKINTCIRNTCAIRPNETEIHRVRIVAGGNRMFYYGKIFTPTVSIKTTKMHWNSFAFSSWAKCMTIDLKDVYFKLSLLEC